MSGIDTLGFSLITTGVMAVSVLSFQAIRVKNRKKDEVVKNEF